MCFDGEPFADGDRESAMPKTRPARKLTPSQRRMLRLRRRAVLFLLVAAVTGALVLADRAGLFGRAPVPPTRVILRRHRRAVVHAPAGRRRLPSRQASALSG